MRHFTPGFMITAAIVGPGSITTASMAGATFGFDLLWVIVFAMLVTMVLQDMAARFGLVSHQGLSESLCQLSRFRWVNYIITGLTLCLLAISNCFMAGGYIIGMAISMHMLVESFSITALVIFAGLLSMAVPLMGPRMLVQPTLTLLILLMVLSFLATMLINPPSPEMLIEGIKPSIPKGSLFTIIAMVGSVAIPYNLFLHSTLTAQKWSAQYVSDTILRCSRLDTFASVGIAGIMMIAVLSTAAVTYFNHRVTLHGLRDIAFQLEPTLGGAAHLLFAIGLFTASLTSAITNPMATGFAICGAISPAQNYMDSPMFRCVWLLVLLIGTFIAGIFNTSCIRVVMIAQAINGVLLPLLALLLLIAINRRSQLKAYRNCWVANIFSLLIIIIMAGLGIAYSIKFFSPES